jgi:hypothetical protein
MKPSSGDKQLGMLSPLKSAAMQSGQTNHPSQNEVGLDVSHHIHLSLEGEGKYFFLDILFHRMSVIAMLRQLMDYPRAGIVSITTVACSERRCTCSGGVLPSPTYVNTYKPSFFSCFTFEQKSVRQMKSCGRFTSA